tara:strand:+ start:84 stop:305 length:222 start_codon:yes stop_codon:yes gene_type:complete
MINNILAFFEKQAFGVCEWWGHKLGINSNRVRIYFIYFSFITFGSPFIIYLIMAFVLENKEWFKSKKYTIWEI